MLAFSKHLMVFIIFMGNFSLYNCFTLHPLSCGTTSSSSSRTRNLKVIFGSVIPLFKSKEALVSGDFSF